MKYISVGRSTAFQRERYAIIVLFFETNTLGISEESVNVDDIIETTNHFRCIDLIIDRTEEKLSESFIKELHRILKFPKIQG